MADPKTLTLFGSKVLFADVAAGAGLALAGAGFLQQGFAARQAGQFNSALARRQAERERQIGERDADLFARRQSALRADAIARRSASGVSFSGSPLLVDDALIAEQLLGEETIRRGGQARESALITEASLQRARGRNAFAAGGVRAGSSLLTAASKFG